jgi:hypothetical protein
VTEFCAERLIVATFAERPDLLARSSRPKSNPRCPSSCFKTLYYSNDHLGRYLDYGLVAVDPA